MPSGAEYQAYGLGGRFSPRNDGSQFFGAVVAAPHYAGMIAELQPQASGAMFDFLIDRGWLTPLNSVESIYLEQNDGLAAHYNSLKGAWNLSLTALGLGKQLLGVDNFVPYQAAVSHAGVQSALTSLFWHPYHNPRIAEDVNDDGAVQVEDVLLLVKDVREFGIRMLPIPPQPPYIPTPGLGLYNDVDADDQATVNDIILVVHYLRAHPAGEPEPLQTQIGAAATPPGKVASPDRISPRRGLACAGGRRLEPPSKVAQGRMAILMAWSTVSSPSSGVS